MALWWPLLAHSEEAAKPIPVAGTEASYQGRFMGVDCPLWTTGTPDKDGLLPVTCEDFVLELDVANDLNPVRLRGEGGTTLAEFKPYGPTLSFPLHVGKRWRGGYMGFTAFNNLVWEGDTRCKVEAKEKITVPAGSFDTFRIECEQGWRVGPATGSTRATRWYAPTPGTVVKEIQTQNPAGSNFELATYALAGPKPAVWPEPTPEPVEATQPPAPLAIPAKPAKRGDAGILDPDEY